MNKRKKQLLEATFCGIIFILLTSSSSVGKYSRDYRITTTTVDNAQQQIKTKDPTYVPNNTYSNIAAARKEEDEVISSTEAYLNNAGDNSDVENDISDTKKDIKKGATDLQEASAAHEQTITEGGTPSTTSSGGTDLKNAETEMTAAENSMESAIKTTAQVTQGSESGEISDIEKDLKAAESTLEEEKGVSPSGTPPDLSDFTHKITESTVESKYNNPTLDTEMEDSNIAAARAEESNAKSTIDTALTQTGDSSSVTKDMKNEQSDRSESKKDLEQAESDAEQGMTASNELLKIDDLNNAQKELEASQEATANAKTSRNDAIKTTNTTQLK